MTAPLLARLRARGVRLELAEDGIQYRAPRGALSDSDRAALVEHRDELVALLRAEGARPPASAERERLRAAHDGLTAEGRARLEAEAAAGDLVAQITLAALAEPPTEPAAAAVEDIAITICRALVTDGPGWVVVYSAVLGEEVLWLRDEAVEMPAEYVTLPRFTRDELALLAQQRPDTERLRAIVDVKREMAGSRVVQDTGQGLMAAREVFAPQTKRDQR